MKWGNITVHDYLWGYLKSSECDQNQLDAWLQPGSSPLKRGIRPSSQLILVRPQIIQ